MCGICGKCPPPVSWRPKHRAALHESQGRVDRVFVKHSYPTLVVEAPERGSFGRMALNEAHHVATRKELHAALAPAGWDAGGGRGAVGARRGVDERAGAGRL